MELLKREYDLCVDDITKPFLVKEILKTTERFLTEVAFFSNRQQVYLDFGAAKRNKIALDHIVYLSCDKTNGALSNKKQNHFINRKAENCKM